jgi:ABC-type bacteriocin/lantibiotic exporter with double-glycine peptidase domain
MKVKIGMRILTGIVLSVLFRSGEASMKSCNGLSGYCRGLPEIRQSTDYTCGPAVLLSLLKFRGLNTDGLTDISLGQKIGTNSEVGTSPEQMIQGLKLFGLIAHMDSAVNPDTFFRHLSPNRDYLFLVLDEGDAHWVALTRYDQNFVEVMDPFANQGQRKRYPIEVFTALWRKVRFDKTHLYHYLMIEIP